MNGRRVAVLWGLVGAVACANGGDILDTGEPSLLIATGGAAGASGGQGEGGIAGGGGSGEVANGGAAGASGGFAPTGGSSGVGGASGAASGGVASGGLGNGGLGNGGIASGGGGAGGSSGSTAGTGGSAGSSTGGEAPDSGPACTTGQKVCGGVCTLPTPNIGCGLDDCTKCPNAAPSNGFLKCTNGTCDFDCFSGFTKNGSSCKSTSGGDGGVCSASSCPSCGVPTFTACCTKNNSCGCTEVFAFGFAPCN